MFRFEDFLGTLDKVSSLLSRHGVSFHLVVGAAGIAYGEPRLTQDIDLVVGNEALASALPAFIESLAESDFSFGEEQIRQAVAENGLFQLLDRVEVLKLDIYPREMVPGELGRTVLMPIFGSSPLPTASREDPILAKLVWISKRSHKSRRDVRVLYRNTDARQQAFIAELAEEFGLTGSLAEVLAKADEIL